MPDGLQQAFTKATRFNFFAAAVIVFLVLMAYINSALPGAAQLRRLVGLNRVAV